MFVLTAKLSKSKLLAAAVILIAAVLLIVLLATADTAPAADAKPNGATNEDRVAFLATFGWSVSVEPTEAQKVRIPDTADNEVFARYNDLQKSQGFDLTEYAGKEVMRYVYEILNYPEASSPVYASVLVCDGCIIGGDVTNTAPEGMIHGFCMPQAAEPPVTVTEATAASEAMTETAGAEQ